MKQKDEDEFVEVEESPFDFGKMSNSVNTSTKPNISKQTTSIDDIFGNSSSSTSTTQNNQNNMTDIFGNMNLTGNTGPNTFNCLLTKPVEKKEPQVDFFSKEAPSKLSTEELLNSKFF